MLWVLHQSMKPLKPRALDPGRAVTDRSGVKIECSSNANHERGLERFNILRHKPLLLWGTHADPDNVRSAFAHLGENFLFFIRNQASERWRVCSNHLQPRELFLKGVP